MLFGVVMGHCRCADTGQNRMAMEDAVFAVFGQGISADARSGSSCGGVAMHPTAMCAGRSGRLMPVEHLCLHWHGKCSGQRESTDERSSDTTSASDIIEVIHENLLDERDVFSTLCPHRRREERSCSRIRRGYMA